MDCPSIYNPRVYEEYAIAREYDEECTVYTMTCNDTTDTYNNSCLFIAFWMCVNNKQSSIGLKSEFKNEIDELKERFNYLPNDMISIELSYYGSAIIDALCDHYNVNAELYFQLNNDEYEATNMIFSLLSFKKHKKKTAHIVYNAITQHFFLVDFKNFQFIETSCKIDLILQQLSIKHGYESFLHNQQKKYERNNRQFENDLLKKELEEFNALHASIINILHDTMPIQSAPPSKTDYEHANEFIGIIKYWLNKGNIDEKINMIFDKNYYFENHKIKEFIRNEIISYIEQHKKNINLQVIHGVKNIMDIFDIEFNVF
jgi:hypothetical protein